MQKIIQKTNSFLFRQRLESNSIYSAQNNRFWCNKSTYIKGQRSIRLIGSISSAFLFGLTAFALHPISTETSSAEAVANPSITTLAMTTGYTAAGLEITPPSTATNTFASSSDEESAKFTVSTNNITGYNLSISHATATAPAPLVNEDSPSGSTITLPSLPAGTSINGSTFSSSDYVGYYGYKPNMLNSSSNSNFISAPTTTSTTINQTSCANNTADCNTVSDSYTIALGANIDYTKPAGNYTNTFILTAVANNVAYTINYKDNTGSGGTTGSDVSNLPEAESSSTAIATSFKLSSVIPTRTGYTFAGWCYGAVTHDNTGNDTCSASSTSGSSAAGDGVVYSAGSTFSFANYSISTNMADLYAMWNVKIYSLTLTFAGTGVSSVKVCKTSGNCSGTDLMGTVSSSGGSVTGLAYNTAYYLYPTFSSGRTLNSWSKTSTYGTLSSTTTSNPTFTMGAGNGAVTISDKAQSYTITLSKSNASAIVIDGTSYTGSSVSLTYGTHTISGTYASGYEFKSWATSNSTNLSITNTSLASTDITVHGTATLTLTGDSIAPIVIIKNTSNMTKVSLNGTDCTSTSGCTISGLSPYTPYQLKAYYTTTSRRFTGWTVSGDGTLATAANAETIFTPNRGTITITPSITTSCTAINSSSYIQSFSFTASHCDSGSLTDRRDNQIYTVARLNGGWWMTRNLAIGCNGSGSNYGSSISRKSLTSTYSNVSSTWSTPTALLSTDENSSATSGYTTAAMQCDATYGAWYNYAAASAGTITGKSNSTTDTYNICPKGWTLPTNSQQSGIASYSSAFKPVVGGGYNGGSRSYISDYGTWWSATAYSTTHRYYIFWDKTNMNTDYYNRYNGFYVRCIRSS